MIVGFAPESSDALTPPLHGALDAPDPEEHQPPVRLDSGEEIPSFDLEEVIPTADEDGVPTGIARGQDEASPQQMGYPAALARAEERWPHGYSVDREEWAQVTSGTSRHLSQPKYLALEAKLNAAEEAKFASSRDHFFDQLKEAHSSADEATLRRAARWIAGETNDENRKAFNSLGPTARLADRTEGDELEPDETFDMDEMHKLARELDEERDATSDVERGSARVIPEDSDSYRIDESFARTAGTLLRLPEETVYPMEYRSAERLLRTVFSEMSEARRRICAIALSGVTSYVSEDEPREAIAITASDIEAWVAEVDRERADRDARHEEIAGAVEARVSEAVRGFSAQLDEPWYTTAAGKISAAAILLIILLAGWYVVADHLAVQRIREKRDAAAAEIGTVRTPNGELATVTTAEELYATAGVSEDADEREIQIVARVAGHEGRLTAIESRDSALEDDRDRAVGEVVIERDQRVRTEVAFDALEELRRQEQAEYSLRQGELESKLSRAERALGVAAGDAETAKVLYKDHVRAGRCGDPLDEAHPADADADRAHYQCGFGLILCDGRLPSQADNCRRVVKR
ncbi:TPA: hypothetical protein DDZ10_00175 [Candidatus Uhrbacteria bacterium]|nr:hypothetical protein [Candidatus Uhrbacteria bacterium]